MNEKKTCTTHDFKFLDECDLADEQAQIRSNSPDQKLISTDDQSSDLHPTSTESTCREEFSQQDIPEELENSEMTDYDLPDIYRNQQFKKGPGTPNFYSRRERRRAKEAV